MTKINWNIRDFVEESDELVDWHEDGVIMKRAELYVNAEIKFHAWFLVHHKALKDFYIDKAVEKIADVAHEMGLPVDDDSVIESFYAHLEREINKEIERRRK